MENNRQNGKSSRIADFITDQLFSFGRCISTDHIAYEFNNVNKEKLSYFVEKVKSRVEIHSHGSKKIEYTFIKINGINMIDFKLLNNY
jgi:hypothetical protein